MKTYSNQMPAVLLNLGDGNWHLNYNIETSEREEQDGVKVVQYEYDTVFIEGEPTRQKMKTAMMEEVYTPYEVKTILERKELLDIGEITNEKEYPEIIEAYDEMMSYSNKCDLIINDALNV